MVIVGTLVWWYTKGFLDELSRVWQGLEKVYDYFSIDLLLKTLFSPFRQISAGRVRGPLAVQMRAFFDRLFSRLIGAVVRVTMIIIGSVWLLVMGFVSLGRLVLWLFLPFLPVLGLALSIGGFVPWKL